MKKGFRFFLLVLLVLPFGCDKTKDTLLLRSLTHKSTEYEGRLAHEWMDLGHQMIRENNLYGPQAARTFGYLGLTTWEAVCHGIEGGKSLAGQV
ncbi:MAG TPA: hypothetical protein PKC51_08710, partial [Ferruginibacter sp.]|nr:hypothetical protein [Ferruginibacter sp.]